MDKFFTLKFLVPTMISVGAFIVSYRAFKLSKLTAKNNKNYQERIETYEYYPIISIVTDTEANKLRLILRNDSSKNSSSQIQISYVLRISAERSYSIDKEASFILPSIFPHEEKIFFPEEVNKAVETGIHFLEKTDPEESHFVFRATATYSSPHPDSEKRSISYTSYFKCLDGQLKKDERSKQKIKWNQWGQTRLIYSIDSSTEIIGEAG